MTTDGENKRNQGAIRALDISVVNKIAAGEIIIHPANALKELLENSIDAESSMIDILIKDGGLKLLQITDNGKGIHTDDLHLLCERFATSKLSTFEDLESIATYGFRGEALASISHISRLSVVTKTKDSPLAYKAFYANGKLATPSFKSETGKNIEPKPIAGKDGTQIIVENLFYNVPSRLKSFRSKSDEFAKILDVVGRYAVHTKGVGFSCKKFGESHQVLSTRPELSLKERIRTVFGTAVANELLDVDVNGDDKSEIDQDTYKQQFGLLKVNGAITNSNYNNKKRIQPVFFINHRLVSCDPLKRALTSIYQFFLPKGNQPFIYLSLEIAPQNLDVNVHPTKREVRFLHEEEIIDVICAQVHKTLSNIDSSRKFKTQGVLFESSDSKRSIDESISSQATKKYRQENKLVRVDASQPKLKSFLSSQSSEGYQRQITQQFSHSQHAFERDHNLITSENDNGNAVDESIQEEASTDPVVASVSLEDANTNSDIEVDVSTNGENDRMSVSPVSTPPPETTIENKEGEHAEIKENELTQNPISRFEEPSQAGVFSRLKSMTDLEYYSSERERVDVSLDSINELREEVKASLHRPLTNIFNNSVYVGIVDEEKRLCCFQYDVKLFLCDYAAVLYDFYYQVALSEFCNYGEFTLSEPILLEDILRPIYEHSDQDGSSELATKETVIANIMGMRDMYREYFNLIIDEDENGKPILRSMPMIMKDIVPSMRKLPFFVYRLGNNINYESEKDCLQGILKQIALLYIPDAISPTDPTEEDAAESQPATEYVKQINNRRRDELNHQLEHVVFPMLKRRFLATRNLLRDVVQIADLPGLYKVFERC